MMDVPPYHTRVCRPVGLALLLIAAASQTAWAADDGPEREQLVAITRQLDLLDRLAEHAAEVSPRERARYHFDYARLREDVKRVRTGVQDYLVPPRAQPRDPVPMPGDYTREDARSSHMQESPP